MNRAEAKAATTAPLRTVSLPLSAWKEKYPHRPKTAIDVGLRLVPAADWKRARKHATDAAWAEYPRPEDFEPRIDVANDHIVMLIAAHGSCSATDVTQAMHGMNDLPEANFPLALTPEAHRYIYEAVHRYHQEVAPVTPTATDAEIAALALRLLPLERIVEATLAIAKDVDEGIALRPRIVAASLRAALPELLARGISFPPLGTPHPLDLRMRRDLRAVLDVLDDLAVTPPDTTTE